MKRIGIITSGGDCGGLNAVIKGAAQMAFNNGIDVRVIPNGYASLYNLVEIESLPVLTSDRLDSFSSDLAGSEAGHSRVKISKIKDPNKFDRIREGMKKHAIDALVISGGDDTGSVMVDLSEHGIKCVHAPKTMDLDLQTYSVGGDSTINRIARFASDLRTTGRTHNRAIVLEVFGRYAGHTAFRGGVAADADCILIPEIPVDFDEVYKHYKETFMRRVRSSDVKAGTYLIIVAEGMTDAAGQSITDDTFGADAFGHKKLSGAAKYVRRQIEERAKKDAQIKEFMKETGMFVDGMYENPEIREVNPGHLVRCGETSAYDVSFGRSVGAAAVSLLIKGLTGVTVAEVSGSEIHYMPAKVAIEQRFVDLDEVSLYETLGTCFGRKPVNFKPSFVEDKAKIKRIY
ncbi:MAG: 6-phosphofructokinase [Oligoflexia bacterium]|nr:6-phosphofructokinase [Oligoflexia bacterium]